jgi:hypothetical protein
MNFIPILFFPFFAMYIFTAFSKQIQRFFAALAVGEVSQQWRGKKIMCETE